LLDAEPPLGPRSLDIPTVPNELKTVPGIKRDSQAEQKAFTDSPLPLWVRMHPRYVELVERLNWFEQLLVTPTRSRAAKRVDAYDRSPLTKRRELDAELLTKRLKQRAAELGMSAVGIAPYDEKYTFEPFLADRVGDRVVVCVLEQNWAATQSVPSLKAEAAHKLTYARLDELLVALADFLRDSGYHAAPSEGGGRGITLHYAVEAGLGQLGLNGQVLTPFAGSRCRLMLIHTDAPLVRDTPVDYGIEGLCDRCQICVRRCPSSAITNQRKPHRGVYKAKISAARCAPVLAQAQGCAICMKVCPVQRYGLPAVLERFTSTGEILGKGTDDLEGYVWPIDGRRYGPGKKPRAATKSAFLQPPNWPADEFPR
jgi:ferredoxin